MKQRNWKKIRQIRNEIMSSGKVSEKKARIIAYLHEYAGRVAGLIDKVSAKDLIETGAINPYLAALLQLNRVEDLVEFFLLRRIERSVGTSFGNVIEYVFRTLFGGFDGKEYFKQVKDHDNLGWIRWWDIVIPEKKIVISVKSGPADMDADQVRYLYDKIVEAERHGWRPFLFLTYGKEPWDVIPNTLKKREEKYRQEHNGQMGLKRTDILSGDNWRDYIVVGVDIFSNEVFSELLPDDIRDYEQLLEIFQEAGKNVGDIIEKVDDKKKQIAEEIKREYTDDVDLLLRGHIM